MASSKTPKSQNAASTPKSGSRGTWAFFSEIRHLLEAFQNATVAQKACLLAMCLVTVFVVIGALSKNVSGTDYVIIALAAAVIVAAISITLYRSEQGNQRDGKTHKCCKIPEFPPTDKAVSKLESALKEIQEDVVNFFREKNLNIESNKICANIFLLAQISGVQYDGHWKLVIHERLQVNMDHPPELGFQFSVGQGATGVAYRDGTYQLTRRQSSPEGQWDRKFLMTDKLSELVHPDLRWIVTFPLLRPHTNESVGVLNIDGLLNIADDHHLHEMAAFIRDKTHAIARYLDIQPQVCVGSKNLGAM